MKTCSKCLIQKSILEFGINKTRSDGLQSYCKNCRNAYLKNWYIKNKKLQINRTKISRNKIKEYLRKYKEQNPCKDCNKFYKYFQMDFDHLRNKKANIANIRFGLENIKKQIEEDCELVCANCHRLRTFNRSQLHGGKNCYSRKSHKLSSAG